MMIEDADDVIQHAQTQERMAYQAKKQAYKQLQKRIHLRYGEDILNLHNVEKYGIEVSPSYESSSITLWLHILPTKDFRKTMKEINEADIEKGYRVDTAYKRSLKEEVQRVVDEWDLETRISIRVRDKKQFERLKE